MIRCPECSAEIDVDEDEVEEGEILSCPECESELEVSQTHPVHLNLIADDSDEEDDDEEEERPGKMGTSSTMMTTTRKTKKTTMSNRLGLVRLASSRALNHI